MTLGHFSSSAPELSVIVLCYRAGERARVFIAKIKELLSQQCENWEIILVGNYLPGVQDDTPAVVRDIASQDPRIIALTLPKEGMMGWDARKGMERARGKLLCLIDGDEQMRAEDIIRVYQQLLEKKLDLVLTFREKRHDGWIRLINSRAYNFILHVLFPGIRVWDANSKPKIMTRVTYQQMKLTSNDWFLDAEIIIKSRFLKLNLAEIPTEFYRLEFRESFVKPTTTLEFIWNILKTRVKYFISR